MISVYLAYIKSINFSGQSAATELIKSVLNDSGFYFTELPMFPLDRSATNKLLAIISWIKKSLVILPNLKKLYHDRKSILYINLGQGYSSFFRVLWWYLPLKVLRPNIKTVISLHGHTFMQWDQTNYKTKLFIYILKSSNIITVLGSNQRHKLMKLGVPEQSILIVPNTCDLESVNKETIIKKHQIGKEITIKILHLSLLIESKGFPQYLEALEILSQKNLTRPIEAIICGPMAFTRFCKILKTPKEKSDWINKKLSSINNSKLGQVHVKWIHGAKGVQKENLFNDAHIFVLPTYFPVEAQPLVLLEAMSKGCAIITSKAGEILSTLNAECAILIDDLSSENIADNILYLMNNDQQRTNITLNGLQIIEGPLSKQSYAKTWQRIFDILQV